MQLWRIVGAAPGAFIGSPLKVTAKTHGWAAVGLVPGGEVPNDITRLEVRVANVGNEEVEGVQVRGLGTKLVKTTCGKHPVTPSSGGGPLGAAQTLAPGAEGLPRAVLRAEEEVCAGSVKAIVRASAAEGVEKTGATTIKVPDTAYITGSRRLAEAAHDQPKTADDEARLHPACAYARSATRRRSRERIWTSTAGTRIKVPNSARADMCVSPMGNKTAEAHPRVR